MTPDEKLTKKLSHRQDYVDIFEIFSNLVLGKLYPKLTPPLGLLCLKLPLKHAFWGQNEILEMYIKSDIGVSRESKITYRLGNNHRIRNFYVNHPLVCYSWKSAKSLVFPVLAIFPKKYLNLIKKWSSSLIGRLFFVHIFVTSPKHNIMKINYSNTASRFNLAPK